MYENGSQLMQKNTGNWSRSTIAPRDANNLRGQSKVRPLYGAEAFATDVDALLNGAPSQNFRTLMKTLTTGTGGQKPSEVILNQFRLQNIEVPEDVRQRIQALDGQEISRAPAPRRTTPQQNGALAGVQIVGGALGNLLVPPAQASPASDLTSMLYASPAAKPRPKPAAPQGGSMTGITTYYTGSGGSDGVVGAMTANNRDRFNPNHMTVAVQRSLRGKYLNKWLIVEDTGTGKSVRVFANDVGSMGGTDKSINRQDPRIVDLSPAAFKRLYGSLSRGTGRVRVRIDSNQQGQSPSRVR
jgi:rare lipoprotein A (peptidoglycan hydrolase)